MEGTLRIAGDVILHVYSEEHDDFEREGADLVTHQNISLMEALLGFKREIKHLDGRMIEIERNKVTEPGQSHEVRARARESFVIGEGEPTKASWTAGEMMMGRGWKRGNGE